MPRFGTTQHRKCERRIAKFREHDPPRWPRINPLVRSGAAGPRRQPPRGPLLFGLRSLHDIGTLFRWRFNERRFHLSASGGELPFPSCNQNASHCRDGKRPRARQAPDNQRPRWGHHSIPAQARSGSWLITGASDDDPSGIGTYSQAGAQLGFAISWTMLFSYPLMVAIQQVSARIGRATGRGIAGNIRQHYSNGLLQSIVLLLLIANTINIGADLGAMADAVSILMGGPHLLYVAVFGVMSALLQVFTKYRRYDVFLKWLTLALFAYFGTVMVVKIPWEKRCADC